MTLPRSDKSVAESLILWCYAMDGSCQEVHKQAEESTYSWIMENRMEFNRCGGM